MNTPLPKPERVRVTVPVSPEVLEAFQKISKATGMSVGRAMGEWLDDTLDAAQFMGQTVEKARAAPKLVAQELHAYALGLGDMTRDMLDEVAGRAKAPGIIAGAIADDSTRGIINRAREMGEAAAGRSGAGGSPGRPAAAPTPPSNTGVNLPTKRPSTPQTSTRQATAKGRR